MQRFRYWAFGLNISSEIECPELIPSDDLPVDVTLRYGYVPQELEQPQAQGVLFQITAEHLLLKLEHVASYLVSNGNEVVIERAPGADSDTVRLFMLGPAFGGLLHQRGLLPLHGSAIAIRQGAVVFLAPTGGGKSLLAAALHQRGYRILADEICAVEIREGQPFVLPAFPRLLLWKDALIRLGVASTDLRRARPSMEKYDLRVDREFAKDAVSIRAIYELEATNSGDWCITPIEGIHKILTLEWNTYRADFVRGMNLGTSHFKQQELVARHCRMARVVRPKDTFQPEKLVELLKKDWE